MAKKSFFRDRDEVEIRKLDLTNSYSERGLIRRICECGESQGYVLRFQIMPPKYYLMPWVENSFDAARKVLKHGGELHLSQPRTIEEALSSREIPLDIRRRDFEKTRSEKREEDFNYIAYSFSPLIGRDQRRRVILFDTIFEGARIYAYAQLFAGGINVMHWVDALRAAKENSGLICSVPSRRMKRGRYNVRVFNVPIIDENTKKAVCWGFKTDYVEAKDPENRKYNIRYTRKDEPESSDIITIYPQDVAAMLSIIEKWWNMPSDVKSDDMEIGSSLRQSRFVPIERSVVALPSRLGASLYTKLNNNVLVYDPRSKKTKHLRRLYRAEKCMLLGKAVWELGHDAVLYWDPVNRDGRIKDYDWRGRSEKKK